jgi:capsular polysaccharide transport system permease protein
MNEPFDLLTASHIERFSAGLRAQRRILGALVLRDMRTRFGGTQLSYLIAMAWPLSHLFSIYLIFVFISKFVPIGGSASIFIATGALPYILCLYPARMVAMTIMFNHNLLMFPIVKTTDLIFARAFVEIMSSLMVVVVFVFTLWSFDVDIMPPDMPEAIAAILASIYLGVSLGVLNVILCTISKLWLSLFIVVMVISYGTSGVSTLQLNLSDNAKFFLSFNPILHLVTWLRTAYYGDYAPIPLSKSYVLIFATVSFCLGLAGDRLLRGRVILQ